MSGNVTPSEEKWRRPNRTPQQSGSPAMQGSQRRPNDRNSYQGQGNYRGGGNWNNSSPHAGSPQTNPSFLEEHVPVRGFNSKEVEDYLQKGYNQALAEAQNPQTDASKKPLLFKPADGVTPAKPTTGAWGMRANVMANGTDFIAQLRKGVASSTKSSS